MEKQKQIKSRKLRKWVKVLILTCIILFILLVMYLFYKRAVLDILENKISPLQEPQIENPISIPENPIDSQFQEKSNKIKNESESIQKKIQKQKKQISSETKKIQKKQNEVKKKIKEQQKETSPQKTEEKIKQVQEDTVENDEIIDDVNDNMNGVLDQLQ